MTDMASDLQLLRADLERELTSSQLLADEPLGARTTYRVGGNAALFVTVESRHDLDVVAAATADRPVDTMVIGRGSNMLVSDSGFDGLAIMLGETFAELDVVDATVRCGAAWSLPTLARRTVKASLTGFEWAVGVPGSLGGAVRMNAGGHGSDIAANLVSVDMVDMRTGMSATVAAGDLDLAYRSSNVATHQLVVSATLALEVGEPGLGQQELTEIVRWRREHQPGGQNAGSVFTNPANDSAGRLIDTCGLRGFRMGTAEVSPKHANFIQADADGNATDIVALMAHIVSVVKDQTQIDLHPETRLVGFAESSETSLL